MLLKFDNKLAADHIELVNSRVDRNPFRKMCDFDAIIGVLSNILSDNEVGGIPDYLGEYIEDIQELLKSPQDYAPHYTEQFLKIVRVRIAAKIKELEGMSSNDRRQLITNTAMREIFLQREQTRIRSKQFPQEFYRLPCPDLKKQLTYLQITKLERHHRLLLENPDICRLVGCGKLTLVKLMSTNRTVAECLSDKTMLKLIIIGAVDESTFFKLKYGQCQRLTDCFGVYELLERGQLAFDQVINIDIIQGGVIDSMIIGYCLKYDLITLDRALELEGYQVSELNKYSDSVVLREISVEEVLKKTEHYKLMCFNL